MNGRYDEWGTFHPDPVIDGQMPPMSALLALGSPHVAPAPAATYFQSRAALPWFKWDSETFLIQPGVQAPQMVTAQWVDPKGLDWAHANVRVNGQAGYALDHALRHCIVSGHNLEFDMASAAASFPELHDLVFECYDSDRAICTETAVKLADIARGCLKKDGYGLAPSVARFAPEAGLELDKEDPNRLRYGMYWNTHKDGFPADAVHYLLQDARAQHALTEALIAFEAGTFPGVFEDLFRKSRTRFWHHLIRCWGQRTNRAKVEAYHARVQADWARDRDRCMEAALVRRDGTSDTKLAKAHASAAWAQKIAAYMQAVPPASHEQAQAVAGAYNALMRAAEAYRAPGKGQGKAAIALLQEARMELPEGCPTPVFTETGDLSLSDDATSQLGDPLLRAYQNYGSLDTLMGKVEKLWAGTVVPIQPGFNLPLETGRSSCREGGKKGKPDPTPTAYGFQMQNPPAGCNPCGGSGEVLTPEGPIPCVLCQGGKIGIRQCFEARPGYVLCSVDYDGFELKGWAQVCKRVLGYSRLADVLNGTIEVTIDGKVKVFDRDPHTELAARLAGITAPEAYTLRARKDKTADAWDLKYRQAAKPANFGFPGGMGAPRFVDSARELYDVIVPLFDQPDGTKGAYSLRAAWKSQWAEAEDYFRWIEQMDGAPIVSLAPEGQPNGMIRGGTSYTERSNHFFQNICASAAGLAGWRLAQECYLKNGGPRGTKSALYGCRIWAFLHDEFVLEIPETQAHEAAERQTEVQIQAAREWMPDLKITAAPALMRNWAKKAKAIKWRCPDANGALLEPRYIPWEDAAGFKAQSWGQAA